MRHLKRHAIPKSWPVKRKGTTFVVRPNSNPERGLPILILLRDLLKIAQNRKEVKRALVYKNIIVNGKYVQDEKNVVGLYDVVNIVPSNKTYLILLNDKGKFKAEEISAEESGKKISKVVGKKILRGKKIQINLLDGRNFISNVKCAIGDSVLINFKDKKIDKCLPLKEKSKVIVFAGKHSGKFGEVIKIEDGRKMASLDSDGEKINVLVEQLMVIK